MINTNNSVELNLCRGEANEILEDRFVSSINLTNAPPSQSNKSSFFIVSEKCMSNTKDKSLELPLHAKERVKVEHLQTHSNLQNNRWNHHHHSLNNPEVNRTINMPNIHNSNRFNKNVSAFDECKVCDKNSLEVSVESGYSNLEYMSKRIVDNASSEDFRDNDKHSLMVCRTEDQENAFRRIEDVHNYSKLNRHRCSNGSSDSSLQEEEDAKDVDIDDETFHRFFQVDQQTSRNPNNHFRGSYDVSEETIRPDHHARRPMNAFLIFCKRHRSIVKDRYRSFENRSITKILGDWWASLDLCEKKCYTTLAQQNKDAFFNANPNFKWYKLPAPPLRTLHMRPSVKKDRDTETVLDDDASSVGEHIFKLADEAQMGDLSTLISDKQSSNQNALQRALGETTEYLSIQIPEAKSLNCELTTYDPAGHKKRKPQQLNSFCSTSNDDVPLPKKSPRLCKGKIYQELINSGQIAPTTKNKLPRVQGNGPRGNKQKSYLSVNDDPRRKEEDLPCSPSSGHDSVERFGFDEASTECRQYSEAAKCNNFSYDLSSHFDLDAKIKELPALSLDVYLQRKRNIKKKKKCTSRKRNPPESVGNASATRVTAEVASVQVAGAAKESGIPNSAFPTVVGSQKRKARKESITRRNISINDNEEPSFLRSHEDQKSFSATTTALSAAPFLSKGFNCSESPSLMSMSPTVEFSNAFTKINNNNISSTSDLFILAELAAERTENSNYTQ